MNLLTRQLCTMVSLCLLGSSVAAAEPLRVTRPVATRPSVGTSGTTGTSARGGVIRAQGEFNESTSRANINNERARSLSLDNDVKQIESHYAKKQIGESEREKDAAKDRAARDKYLSAQENNTPVRLSSREFDPTTAKISWPEALRARTYDAQRREIEQLFLQRVQKPEQPGTGNAIHQACRELQADLKDDIRDHQSQDYLAAKKFLEGLMNEARSPSTSAVVTN